jgi:hypothetical protein
VSFVRGGGGSRYLGTGWSVPEAPGVWSVGTRAELLLVPRELPAGREADLRIMFHPYFGPSVTDQTIGVFVNGVRTDEWKLTMQHDQGRCCERTIALPQNLADGEVVSIAFQIARPRTSVEPNSREIRELGISLASMTLTASGSPR